MVEAGLAGRTSGVVWIGVFGLHSSGLRSPPAEQAHLRTAWGEAYCIPSPSQQPLSCRATRPALSPTLESGPVLASTKRFRKLLRTHPLSDLRVSGNSEADRCPIPAHSAL
jgi:hypothetical protein